MSEMSFFAKKFGGYKSFPYLCTKYLVIMKKKTIIMAVLAYSLLAVPAAAAPMSMELGVAEQIEESAPTISVEGNIVSVSGASGMKMEVVSLTGRAVASYKIEGPAQRIELNLPKGCYILKVGKTVRKVTVQ